MATPEEIKLLQNSIRQDIERQYEEELEKLRNMSFKIKPFPCKNCGELVGPIRIKPKR